MFQEMQDRVKDLCIHWGIIHSLLSPEGFGSQCASQKLVIKCLFLLGIKYYIIRKRAVMMRFRITFKMHWLLFYSLWPPFFIKFYFFHQMIALQKLWKMFISSKKLFLFSSTQIFAIFPLLFHTFQIQKNKWRWNNLWCHELDCINLQV